MLESDKDKQKDLFDFVNGMYSLRGKVVHGNPPSKKYMLDIATVNKLQETLRASIKLWFVDQDAFSQENLRNVVFK